MITRTKALNLLKQYIKTKNTIKHMIALEAVMKALAQKLEPGKEEEWAMAGLLHDLDYETVDQKTFKNHGLKTVEILKKEKVGLPNSVYQAITSHNYKSLGAKYSPKTLMDWAIFIADSLTGLIVATALVHPDKKLSNVKVKSVLKKFKDKAFARGTRREDIKLCQEKLGIPLRELIEISLKAMQEVSEDLGL